MLVDMDDAPEQHLDPAAEAPALVPPSKYCIQCGYLLEGLAIAGKCPECGTDVALSLREPTLASSSPEYIRTLKSGLSLVLNGLLLMVLTYIMLVPARVMLGPSMETMLVAGVVVAGVMLILWALILLGYWRMTVPDPAQVAQERNASARRLLRGTVIVWIVWQILSVVQWGLEELMGPVLVLQIYQVVAPILFLVTVVVHVVVAMQYARWLGTRVPDQRLVRRAHRYRWQLPGLLALTVAAFVGLLLVGTTGMRAFGALMPLALIVMLLCPLIALIMYWNLLDRLRKHVKAIARGEPRAELKGVDPRG